jgi:hypothetical protein
MASSTDTDPPAESVARTSRANFTLSESIAVYV